MFCRTDTECHQIFFSNLEEFIEHFKQPDQGLPCELKVPIVKESTRDHFEDDSGV